MSDGKPMPIATAMPAAKHLRDLWFTGEPSMVVGSLRRSKAEIGDVDILVMMPDFKAGEKLKPEADRHYLRISRFLRPAPEQAPSLFGEQVEREAKTIGVAVEGLKPGFKACNLRIDGIANTPPFSVQVFRATAESIGWAVVERTGPTEFGIMFLAKWKERWGIPIGDPNRKASRDGNLLDAEGNVVPVRSEKEAFEKCGLTFADPRQREAIARHWQKASRSSQ